MPDEVGNPLPNLSFTTSGNFTVPGVSGESRDIVQFTPTSLGQTTAGSFNPNLVLDGSARGLSGFDVNDFWIGAAPGDPLTGVTTASVTGFSAASAPTVNGADLVSLLAIDDTTNTSSQNKKNMANRLSNVTTAAATSPVQTRKAVESFFLNAKRAGVKVYADDPTTVAAALANSLAGLLG